MSSPLSLSLLVAFLLLPGQDSRKTPDKAYRPFTLAVVASEGSAESEAESLEKAVQSVKKELERQDDWFRMVKDRQEAEVVVEIVKDWVWTGTEGVIVQTGPTMPNNPNSPSLQRSMKDVRDRHHIEANIFALGNPLHTVTSSSDNVNQPDTFAGSKEAKRRFSAQDMGRKINRLCKDNYWTLLDLKLILSAWQGNTKEVKNLLDAGAAAEAQDNDGVTILMWAVLSTNPDTVQAVLDAGADVNAVAKDGATASLLAADDSDILELLKKSGAK